ncbi:MAG: transcription antitermination factor NusB [Thermomicrobiales bacterium]|nr:transcription antitermination factor NusB [Thermomicrobiales bacterium]
MSGRRGRGFENRQARTLALQILFEGDLTDHTLEDIARRYTADMNIPQPVRRYLERLVSGVSEHLTEIDASIGGAATAFPVAQLPAVDRNILRVAIYELRHEQDVPMKAAINEAVELAKAFGGDNSSRFVNGVLGTIARTMPAAPQKDADEDADSEVPEVSD